MPWYGVIHIHSPVWPKAMLPKKESAGNGKILRTEEKRMFDGECHWKVKEMEKCNNGENGSGNDIRGAQGNIIEGRFKQ